MNFVRVGIGALALVGTLGSLSAAVIGEWNADGYVDGTDWVGTTNATVREGTPTGGVASFDASNNISYVNFSTTTDTAFQTTNPVTGLSQFSVSVVFRTTSNGSAGENDFWRNEGLAGIELPGGGVGDWGVGIAAGGLINGGSALGGGDTGSIGPAVNDNAWHTVSLVLADLGNGTHDRRLYLDGAEVASDLSIAYGGGSSVAAGADLFFGDHAPGDGNTTKENFQGDIAHILLHDVPLTPSEIAAAHGNYLGTLEFIPEPSSSALLALTGLLALRRRRP